jgi:peptide/nickel transport system substrate-binding protein
MNRIFKHIVIIVVLSLVSLSFLPIVTPFHSSSQINTTPSGFLRVTLVGQPTSLNQLTAPSNCVSCWEIMELENAFGMPVWQNGSFDVQAGLFNGVTTNANATVWNLNIRSGATWSDGNPITSDDVNFTFGLKSNYIMNTARDFIRLTQEIKSVNVVNSSDIEFVLGVSDSRFGYVMSSQYYYMIVPEHVWAGQNYTSNNNFQQDVTSGPFYHLAYNGGSSLVLKANPHYWDGPGLAEIDVNFVSSNSVSESLLTNNQTDLAQVDLSAISQFQNNPQYSLKIEPDRGILYAEYNVSEAPFNEQTFRQAMAYAINTSAIVQDVYSGYATPGVDAPGLIPPSASAWYNQSATGYDYSLSQAKSRLVSIGYSYNSAGSLLYPNGTAVSLRVYTDTDVPSDALAAGQVVTYLQALGITTTLTQGPLDQIAQNYSLAQGGIRSGVYVGSTMTPLFGLGYLDVQPAFRLYYPWFVEEAQWITPTSANNQYRSWVDIVNSSVVESQVSQAILNIDALNAEYVPLIPLAYPDTAWVWRNNPLLTGFPQSAAVNGFDMGDYSLDPYTFSQISCSSILCPLPTSTTTTSANGSGTSTTSFTSGTQTSGSNLTQITSSGTNTTTLSSSTSSSTSTSLPISAPSNPYLKIIAIVVVIAAIAVGTVVVRMRRKQPNA